MNKVNFHKRAAIAVAICWLVYIACMDIAMMLFTIIRPDIYRHMMLNNSILFAFMLIHSIFSAIIMFVLYYLSKKASIQWLKIIALIHFWGAILFVMIAAILLIQALLI